MTAAGSQLPNFVIVGAARSGTTSLFGYLRAHPQVYFPAHMKEVHFFDQRWDRGVDWYRSLYRGATDNRALGDATPSYMYDGVAVGRMAQVLPDARLIAILRNPADRAYSHYWLKRSGRKEKLSFEDAIEAEDARLAAPRRGRGEPGSCAYIDRGRYLPQLERLCEHFDRDRLLVLIFEEDLREDPTRGFQLACRHLGIDDCVRPDELGQVTNRPVALRSRTLRKVERRVPSTVGKLIDRFNERSDRYPPMNDALRGRLIDRYDRDNDALQRWLGRDLSVWKS